MKSILMDHPVVRRRRSDFHPRTGGTLLFALIAVSTVAIVAVGYLQLVSIVSRRQSLAVDDKHAFYLAEAGLAEAYSGMMIGRSGNVGSQALPAGFGDGLFWVEADEHGNGRVDLVSTGMYGGGKAVLSVVVQEEADSVVALGVFGSGQLVIEEGVLIDGYDSTLGTYADQLAGQPGATFVGKAGSNGAVSIRGGEEPTSIHGDLNPGPGEGVAITGDVTITGATLPRAVSTDLAPIVVPSIPASPLPAMSLMSPTILHPGEHYFPNLNLGRSTELVIQGPTTLVVGNLVMTGSSSLHFDTTLGSVRVYVENGLAMSPGTGVSTSSEDASQVAILYAGVRSAQLEAGGQLHGVVYAPGSEVRVGGNLEVFGAVIVDDLHLLGGARLHYDRGLASLSTVAGIPSQLSWRILEISDALPTGVGADPFSILGVDRTVLPRPIEAHSDQMLNIEYVDLLGVTTTYYGLESLFDWTDVSNVEALARGADAVTADAAGGVGGSIYELSWKSFESWRDSTNLAANTKPTAISIVR